MDRSLTLTIIINGLQIMFYLSDRHTEGMCHANMRETQLINTRT